MVGLPDRDRINYPKAFIVLNDVENAENVKKEILDLCRKNLPGYMVPEEIEFVVDLPRTQRGKIDYRALQSDQ